MADKPPPKVQTIQDDHGTVYVYRCPHCGRERTTRQPGEVRCSCGKTTTVG